MKAKMLLLAVVASAGTILTPISATAQQIFQGHVPEAIGRLHLQSVGRPPATNRLQLAIGLPLRNREALNNLLQQLYDPASANYHKYLTPEQFTERFGPTEQEYQAVINFAATNGLEVVRTYDNRVLLDVSGKVSEIEKTFHVTLLKYQHPKEAREFFAPDIEPSVDTGLPIVNISGLNNYASSHPNSHIRPEKAINGTASGSGPGGNYKGYDFRNAYVPGVTLDGSGQSVGLFEMDGYYLVDITNYENQAGITPHVAMTNVLLNGLTGTPNNKDAVCEVSLDIEMAISMAPGLSKVVVFEGTSWDDILNTMVSANYYSIKQFSCSWGFDGPVDATMENDFLQMAAHGQSFFLASGDGDAFTSNLMGPDDDTNITTVGGTTLTMSGTGASYTSEKVWNWGYLPPAWWYSGNGYWGSSGGISTRTTIPAYQQGISMVPNEKR